jgi:hypothetical protein
VQKQANAQGISFTDFSTASLGFETKKTSANKFEKAAEVKAGCPTRHR